MLGDIIQPIRLPNPQGSPADIGDQMLSSGWMLGSLFGLATEANVHSSHICDTPSPPAPAHIWCSESPSKWHCVDIHPAPREPEVNLLVEAPCWGVSNYHYLEKGFPG